MKHVGQGRLFLLPLAPVTPDTSIPPPVFQGSLLRHSEVSQILFHCSFSLPLYQAHGFIHLKEGNLWSSRTTRRPAAVAVLKELIGGGFCEQFTSLRRCSELVYKLHGAVLISQPRMTLQFLCCGNSHGPKKQGWGCRFLRKPEVLCALMDLPPAALPFPTEL